jgi:hypothetical protein
MLLSRVPQIIFSLLILARGGAATRLTIVRLDEAKFLASSETQELLQTTTNKAT